MPGYDDDHNVSGTTQLTSCCGLPASGANDKTKPEAASLESSPTVACDKTMKHPHTILSGVTKIGHRISDAEVSHRKVRTERWKIPFRQSTSKLVTLFRNTAGGAHAVGNFWDACKGCNTRTGKHCTYLKSCHLSLKNCNNFQISQMSVVRVVSSK